MSLFEPIGGVGSSEGGTLTPITSAEPIEIGSGHTFTDTANWAEYDLTEVLEENFEYQFIMQRGNSPNAISITESFTGSLFLDLPDVAAGAAYSANTEDNQLNLVFGRNQAAGALALSIGHRGSADTENIDSILVRIQDTQYRIKSMLKLPLRSGTTTTGSSSSSGGPERTEDEIRDIAGNLISSLGAFSYDANTNTLTFALRDGDIPAEIARDSEVSTAINNLRDLLRGGVSADRDTLKELADAIAAIMAGSTWLAPSNNAPVGGADGQWALRTGNNNPGIYYRASGVWTRVFSLPDLSGYALLTGATFTGEVNVPDPTEAEHAANKRYVDDNAHDSSAAGSSSDDHRRIERLEHLTQDISLQELDDWIDAQAADVPDYAVFLNQSITSLVTSDIPGYAWAENFAVPLDGRYRILIRLRQGLRLTSARVVAHRVVQGDTITFEGLWDKTRSTPGFISEHTEGGFVYYEWSAYFDFGIGDSLAIQHLGIVEEHTQYAGQLPALDRHAAEPYAHQDSPVRVSHLGIGAPVGRRVYLTEAFNLPGMEHIYDVPLSEIGHTRGRADFFGATVADFSSIGGPGQVPGAAYPAIMNTARVAGIWQQNTGINLPTRPIFVAVLGSIGTPTYVHMTPAGLDRRFALTQDVDNPMINLGGQVHRIMRTEALRFQELEQIILFTEDLRFSLEYPAGYLADDGTIDAGTTQEIGNYESLGNGRWRNQNAQVIEWLKAALADASDADKFALIAGLHAAPEVLYTENVASQKSRTAWTNIRLNRAITNDDLGKTIVIRFWNTRARDEVEMSVRRFLTLPTQNPATDNNTAIAEVFPVASGNLPDIVENNAAQALLVSRPTTDPQTTDRILLGSSTFGQPSGNAAASRRWGPFQIQIELRSLV